MKIDKNFINQLIMLALQCIEEESDSCDISLNRNGVKFTCHIQFEIEDGE